MNGRISIRIPHEVDEAIRQAAKAHNITLTKYILRVVILSLLKEGYLNEITDTHRADHFLR